MQHSASRLLTLALLLLALREPSAAPAPFAVTSEEPGFVPPRIVIQHDPAAGTGVDWETAKNLHPLDASDAGKLRDAVVFLEDAIQRMTGTRLEVESGNDLSRGIVLTTLAAAPEEMRADPAVRDALANDGSDSYNDREAFFIRSEPRRLMVVANTIDGLVAAVAALMESVDYEVLGMGPNWVYVPAERKGKPLAFNLETSGRPSYYLRQLAATSGQSYGIGTIASHNTAVTLSPPDEHVGVSHRRWQVGSRTLSQSMPGFPGHALQAYHRAVVEHIRATGDTRGFLAVTHLGADASRPAAEEGNAGHLWINSDAEGDDAGKVYLSDGKEWREANLAEVGANLDLSVPSVRALVLERMKKESEEHFARHPDAVFVFGTDPEDGAGYARLAELLHDKSWYTDYLAAEGLPFGRPYVLHGFKGLDQPTELWDPAAPADTVFGFNNWLLREYDKWLASRPEAERVTAAGAAKSELVRCSLYCYNYHDVPPNFNLDPRIRVMIAGYPKHRGLGKWKEYATQIDLAQAYQKMLPREPSGDYRIISLAYYWDMSLEGIPASWSAAPDSIAKDLTATYDAGIKAMTCETDFNFGKFGLAYYLFARQLWDVRMSPRDLDALRDRWLRRAYGSGAQEMKAYYDFMLSDNFAINAPNNWARAVRLIDAADKRLDPQADPDAKARLDDLKQYWYFYYLLDTGQATPESPAMREFAWKGQMAYMTAMHAVLRKVFNETDPAKAAGDFARGPARYTPEETARWWAQVLDHWRETPVTRFADATLADGTRGASVDVNDLVLPDALRGPPAPGFQPFLYNSGYMKPANFLTVADSAGDEIGFKLLWIAQDNNDRYYMAKDVPYGVERWDAEGKRWEPVVDKSVTSAASSRVEAERTWDKQPRHLVEVRVKAPAAGTYRFDLGYGGNLAYITSLDFDLASGQLTGRTGFTHAIHIEGLTQSPSYIYIPKGTASLDLETWDSANARFIVLAPPPPDEVAGAPAEPRRIDVSKRGTHRIPLQAGEDGAFARIEGNLFAFPFLYSVPNLWAKSPEQLLVPRAVAEADGLTGAGAEE